MAPRSLFGTGPTCRVAVRGGAAQQASRPQLWRSGASGSSSFFFLAPFSSVRAARQRGSRVVARGRAGAAPQLGRRGVLHFVAGAQKEAVELLLFFHVVSQKGVVVVFGRAAAQLASRPQLWR